MLMCFDACSLPVVIFAVVVWLEKDVIKYGRQTYVQFSLV